MEKRPLQRTQRHAELDRLRHVTGRREPPVMDGSGKFPQRKHLHANNSICLLAARACDATTGELVRAAANKWAARRNARENTQGEKGGGEGGEGPVPAAEVMR